MFTVQVFYQSEDFQINVDALYSPTVNTTNAEVSFGYSFMKSASVKLLVNFYDLGFKSTTVGESVSVALNPFPLTRFYMQPEVGVGAIHGRFNGDNSGIATKCQLPVAVTVGYYVNPSFTCGLVAKYDFITNYANLFLCGFRFAACF